MSHFPNRRWLVIPASEVPNIDFNQVHETSPETLRFSVDGTQTFVKYEVTVVEEETTSVAVNAETGEETTTVIPAGVYGRPSVYKPEYQEYDHEGILALLSGLDWTVPNPEEGQLG